MALKENFVGLFVKRFVIPGAQYFNKPGFVDFKISGKTELYARQIFYPEFFFINLEKSLIEKYGDAAKEEMYKVGKRFGYRFAQSGKFENVNDHKGDSIKDWILIASKFVEGTYASSIENTCDPKLKKTEYMLKNFVILRELSYDYIFALGGTAGLMSWIFQDKTIEAVFSAVKKSKSGYEAKVIAAPISYLKKNFKGDEIYFETDLDDLLENFLDYKQFNHWAEISNKKSFQSYIDAKFISYQQGIVELNSNRLFLFEVSGTYLLEKELRELDAGYISILFETAYLTGKKIISAFAKDIPAIFEILSALGWGEVIFFSSSKTSFKVLINHFPWSKWYKDIEFVIQAGILSGIFSAKYNKKIIFEKPTVDFGKGHLSLLFEAKL